MTKAQEKGITKFPYTEKNKYGDYTYWEYEGGRWSKWGFDENTKFKPKWGI